MSYKQKNTFLESEVNLKMPIKIKENFEHVQDLFDKYGLDNNVKIGNFIIFLTLSNNKLNNVRFSPRKNKFIKGTDTIYLFVKQIYEEATDSLNFEFYEDEILGEEKRQMRGLMFFDSERSEVVNNFLKFYPKFVEKENLEKDLPINQPTEKKKVSKI